MAPTRNLICVHACLGLHPFALLSVRPVPNSCPRAFLSFLVSPSLPFFRIRFKIPSTACLSLSLFMTVCFQSLNGLWGEPVSRRYWATVFGKEFGALSKCAWGLDSCRSPKTCCWNKRAECIKGPFHTEIPRGEMRNVCLSFNFIYSPSHFSSRERWFSIGGAVLSPFDTYIKLLLSVSAL